MPSIVKEPAADRFWRRVNKAGPTSCWEWTASTRQGYGAFSFVACGRKRCIDAHRFSWLIHFGPVPPGWFVCHSCDNRRCVRPEHLWLGTCADNIRDASAKGRLVGNRMGNSGRPRVTPEQIADMVASRARGETFKSIGERVGIGAPGVLRWVRKAS